MADRVPPEERPLRLNFAENSRGSTRGLQPEILEIMPKVTAIFRKVTAMEHFQPVINAGQEWHNGHKRCRCITPAMRSTIRPSFCLAGAPNHLRMRLKKPSARSPDRSIE